MDYQTAFARLTMIVRPDDEPTLDSAELDLLLVSHAQTADADEVEPSEDDWTPTYSVIGIYRAAAEGWTMKAGRAAGRFDFTTDGQQFHRSQVVDHCEGQAAHWRRKTGASAGMGWN